MLTLHGEIPNHCTCTLLPLVKFCIFSVILFWCNLVDKKIFILFMLQALYLLYYRVMYILYTSMVITVTNLGSLRIYVIHSEIQSYTCRYVISFFDFMKNAIALMFLSPTFCESRGH